MRVEEGSQLLLLDSLFIGVDLSAQPGTTALALSLHTLGLLFVQECLLEVCKLGGHEMLAHLLAETIGGCMGGSIYARIFSVDVLFMTLVADGTEGGSGLIGIDTGQPIFEIGQLRNLLHSFDILIAYGNLIIKNNP